MAVDMFLEISTLKGETRDKAFGPKGAMDVLAFSFGMSNSGTAHVGGGAGAGKVNVQDISVTKWVDKCSPTLMLACCNGKHFEKAVLTARKAGEKPIEYMRYTMNEVMITSISTGGSGGEDRLTENVSLNFAKFKFEYPPQKQDGSADAAVPMDWDIAANDRA